MRRWPAAWHASCGAGGSLRLDPCGCAGDWKFAVICDVRRALLRMTEIYLMDASVQGVLPASVGNFTELVALSLVGTSISGSLPASIGNMPSLEMVWLDHNPKLGGQHNPLSTISVSQVI